MSKGCSFFCTPNFSYLLLANILSLCDFIYSQPLYVAYLISFLPHLLQVLLFLCPLLLSTSLLLIVLLAVFGIPNLETSNWRYGLFLFACQVALDMLETRMDGEVMFHLSEPFMSIASELEAYIDFEAPSNTIEDDQIDETIGQCQHIGANESKEVTNSSKGSFGWKTETQEHNKETEMPTQVAASNNIGESANQGGTPLAIKNRESQVQPLDVEEKLTSLGSRFHRKNTKEDSKYTENSQKDFKFCDMMGLDLKGYRSRKRVKEWKRTLACKLYEERLLVQGTKKMDLLWEVYEADSGSAKEKNSEENAKNGKLNPSYVEKEEMDEQLCCLEAIRFLAMRISFGMRKPNLVKISKALKGVGMFVKRNGKTSRSSNSS